MPKWILLLLALIAGAALAGCSDDQQGGEAGGEQGSTSLNVDTDDGSVSYESGDTSVSVGDGEDGKDK